MAKLVQSLKGVVRRFHEAKRGNIIVIAMMFTLVGVAAVWSAIGLGDRLIMREQLQGSADAAAFSCAVVKAKGLNILAFLNIVMAIVAAIMLLVSLLSTALDILAGALDAICVACVVGVGCWACPLAPEATELAIEVSDINTEVQNVGNEILKALETAETVVNEVMPIVAAVVAYTTGTNAAYGSSLVSLPTPLPIVQENGLPTEKDDNDTILCDKGAAFVQQLIDKLADALGGIAGTVINLVGEGVATLMEGYGQIFCPLDGQPRKMVDDWQTKNQVKGWTLKYSGVGATRRHRAVAVGAAERNPELPILDVNLTFAQSEYYCTKSDINDCDLWTMDWRARLKRFKFSTSGGDTPTAGSSTGTTPDLSGAASQTSDAIDQFNGGGSGGGNLLGRIQDALILH